MYYGSKKDALYSSLIWGTIVFILITILVPFIVTLSIRNFIWAFFGSGMIGFFLWLWFGTWYRIDDEKIHIQHGPFKQAIKISEITKLSKQRSVWSAASLSMDRLVIKHKSAYTTR